MKLHEAKLLLNDPTFSIDSITYQELEMDSDYVDVHEDISYSKDNVDLHSHTFLKFYFVKVVLCNIWSAIPVISWLKIPLYAFLPVSATVRFIWNSFQNLTAEL